MKVYIQKCNGIVHDSFNILRLLLDRLEDKNNSKVINQLQVEIPDILLKILKKLLNLQKMI